jgi:polysaccharide deacetylase family sporulation protein PdaB
MARSRLKVAGLIFFIALSAEARVRQNRPGIVYWHGSPMEHKVALTFDDGPNEPYTSEILKILSDYHVKATFFLVGANVDHYPDVAGKIVREGHSIGNHSYGHPDLILDLNPAVRRQILRAETAIESATGKSPTLFRPPYGAVDPLTLKQTEDLGYVVILWSVASRDWTMPGVSRVVRNVLIHVQNGSIILMHDGAETRHGADRSQTVAALPVIITELRKQGYEFVTIPELLHLNE